MKKNFLLLTLIIIVMVSASDQDSLSVTHFALNFTLNSRDDEFLKIADNEENVYFQGLYQSAEGFSQTLILPLSAETLFVALGDSLKVLAIDNTMSELSADFTPPPAPWKQRLLWLLHDLEKVFPIIALAIIFVLKRQHDRKNDNSEVEEE
jgi:hypothetical protein